MLRLRPKGFSLIDSLLIILVVCLLVVAALLVLGHNAGSGKQTGGPAGNESLQPPTIPNGHAYLGAFVNPEHISAGSSNQQGSNVTQQLPAFTQLVGKPLKIVHFYMPFKNSLPTTTLETIEANGSIPMISWGCADVHAISDGQYDSTINSFAGSLKSFGKPVFLRWYWEMNQINKTGGQPAGNRCGGYNNGTAFVAAWQHIYRLFHEAGVSNVAFVWCPGYSGGNFITYYPGDNYVDWIGLDRYERTQNNQPVLSFGDMFGSYYKMWAPHGKPIMIAETAAMGSTDQAQYLNDVLTEAPKYPGIKAFVYFDATGPAGDWSLQGDGASAFKALAASQYFSC